MAKKPKPKAPAPMRGIKIMPPKTPINRHGLHEERVSGPSSIRNAPSHLRPDTAAWWLTVATDFELESHHLRLLTLACESWDRGVEAREALAKHGTTYNDRWGQPRARPEVAMERDARIGFARMVRELALDIEPPDDTGRPPRLDRGAGRRAPAPGLDHGDRQALGLD